MSDLPATPLMLLKVPWKSPWYGFVSFLFQNVVCADDVDVLLLLLMMMMGFLMRFHGTSNVFEVR